MSHAVDELPSFFRVRQTFPRPQVADLPALVNQQISTFCPADLTGKSVAITVGSRGIAQIDKITSCCVQAIKHRGGNPFLVPAMGSHGGATEAGQIAVLQRFGISEQSMGCPIRSSMEAEIICTAPEGFPVYFDRYALAADFVLVVNRVKSHTRFAGEIESGLMKMMLIGLGKQLGAEVYHRVVVNFPFDQIVRSVAREVIQRCRILGGLAILENGYEETADIVGLAADDIERGEPALLQKVKAWSPKLPFDNADVLVVDRLGKDVSGSGMDSNVIGRKRNDHIALGGEKPSIGHIYVRGLTKKTCGNASGIGMAELCHRRVVEAMDRESTFMNCITAGHVVGAMLPIDFSSDLQALKVACQLSGFVPPSDVSAMWIRDTLSLAQVECSEAFYPAALNEPGLEILSEPRPLEFDAEQNLLERFEVDGSLETRI